MLHPLSILSTKELAPSTCILDLVSNLTKADLGLAAMMKELTFHFHEFGATTEGAVLIDYSRPQVYLLKVLLFVSTV